MIHNDPLNTLYTEQVRSYTNMAYDVVYAMAWIVKKYGNTDPRELSCIENLREAMLATAQNQVQRHGSDLDRLRKNESVRRWMSTLLIKVKPDLAESNIVYNTIYGWHVMHPSSLAALNAAFADVKLALTEEERANKESGINTDF